MPSGTQFVHLIPASLTELDAVRAYANAVSDWQIRNWQASSCVLSVNSESIVRQLEDANPDVVYLHYVNYGYAKRGCPQWLLTAIEKTKEKLSYTLITFFHEICASGRIWSSSFWTSPFQKRIARRLLLSSRCCVTTLQLYQELLLSLAPAKKESIEVFPVLSVLGEPQTVPSWSGREPILVILGGVGSRTRLYTESAQELKQVCDLLQIHDVLDFGPEVDITPSLPSSVSWKRMGLCEPKSICSHLLSAKAGLMNYPNAFLGKSTVFASYAAHGVLPICASNRDIRRLLRSDALRAGFHYWDPVQPLVDAESIVRKANEWYSGHSLEHLSQMLASNLSSSDLARLPGRIGA